MQRFGLILAVVLGVPQLLDASIFGRSTAKVEYEQLKSKIATVGKDLLDRVERFGGNTELFNENWENLVTKVNVYSAKYGGKVSQGYEKQLAESQKLIAQNRFQIIDDDWQQLVLHVEALQGAIKKVAGDQFTFRERRYALELYKALFEQLRDAAEKLSDKFSIQGIRRKSLDVVGKNLKQLVRNIENPHSKWSAFKKFLRENAPTQGLAQNYQKVLSDVERYAGLSGDAGSIVLVGQLKTIIPANIKVVKNKPATTDDDRRAKKLYDPLMDALEKAFQRQG